MRLGILGGTFDPIHFGHLFIAEEARVRFDLQKVMFLPNGQPPHKNGVAITPAIHRYAMSELAIRSNPDFFCSDIEIERPGKSYTVDTLNRLRKDFPQAELFYIAGIDAMIDFLTWKRHEEVIEIARFLVAVRDDHDYDTLEARLPGTYMPHIERLTSYSPRISSTGIRNRLREGKPIRYLLPDDVLDYISRHNLYCNAANAAGATPTV